MKMKKLFALMLSLIVLSAIVSSCDNDDDEKEPDLENKLIGTWQYEDVDYSYELTFEEDLTGNRTDSDGENDDFTYTFTADKINFVTGFPNGEYSYTINGNTLSLFGDTLVKQ